MESINRTFLRELLYEKTVTVSQEQFVGLHHIIFPCEEMFENFLLSDNEQEQKEHSKSLFQILLFQSKAYLCPDIFDALIDTETNYPVKDYLFIPQDHVLHSINVYLLGVYLYFNHQLLHDKLNEFFSDIGQTNSNTPLFDTTLSFIEAWKVFAICHDIGYPFEKLISKDGNVPVLPKPLQKYLDLANRVEYDEATRSLSVCILASCICDRSNKELGVFLQKHHIDLRDWDYIQLGSGSHLAHNLDLSDLSNYKKLYGVLSYQDAITLIPLISLDDLIFYAHSSQRNDCYFIIKQGNEYCCFKRKDSSTPCIDFLRCPTDDYEFDVYCKDPQKQLHDNSVNYTFLECEQEDWMDVARSFGNRYVTMATKRYYTCKDALIDIYFAIRNYFPYALCKCSYERIKAEKTGNQNLLKQCLVEDIIRIIDDCEEKSENLHEAFDSVTEQIQYLLSDDSYRTKVMQRMIHIENQENSRLETISRVLNPNYYGVKTIAKKDLQKKPMVFRKRNSSKKCTISLTPLIYSNSTNLHTFTEFCQDLRSEITSNLSQMGIIVKSNLRTIQDYRPDWCAFDHGLLSAHILMYVAAWREQCKQSTHYSFMNIAAKNAEANSNPTSNLLILAESISAILIHNIYVSQYEKINGISYSLSLDNHPLSFFGALCDAIQIWDRRHSADQSRIVLKNFNPTHHQMSISIKRNSVILTIETDNPQKTGKVQRDNMDQFLQGASSLIKINLIEEKT